MCFLIFQTLIDTFQNHFMVRFDAAKKSTTEEIRECLISSMWSRALTEKELIAKSKLRLSIITWKRTILTFLTLLYILCMYQCNN